MRIRRVVPALAVALWLSGCGLDLENPNAPTEEEVLGSIDGVIALAVGMQGQFAAQVEEFIQAPALVTDEWGTNTRSLPSYRTLLEGPPGAVDAELGVVEEPFAAAYQIVKSANNLIEHAPRVGLSPAMESGILALARLFKAMALGTIIQQFEEVPLAVDQESPPPVPRAQVLAEVLGLLEAARGDLAGVSEADLEPFRTRVLGTGFDVAQTVDAMLARHHLIAGNHEEAIAAAERVDPDVLSVFTYVPPDRNPVENLMLQLLYTAPLASWAAAAEAGDGRVGFWVDETAEPFGGNPPDTLLVPPGQYSTAADPFPAYLPDEMKLIRAEAHARLGRLDQARELINQVRTQAASPVEEPVANLPPLPPEALDTLEEVLDQIAYERGYELFLQGLRWEDTRRLGVERTTTPTIQWLPLPRQECLANPAAGC